MGFFDWAAHEDKEAAPFAACPAGRRSQDYLMLVDQLSRLKMIEQKARANADLCAVLCQKAEISYAAACLNTREMEKLIKAVR